jgi:hypothetical protein
MSTVISQEITIGSFVGIKRHHEQPEAQAQADKWIKAYGRGPFEVIGQIDQYHVSLRDTRGNPMHFGDSDYLSIHIDFVELWQF